MYKYIEKNKFENNKRLNSNNNTNSEEMLAFMLSREYSTNCNINLTSNQNTDEYKEKNRVFYKANTDLLKKDLRQKNCFPKTAIPSLRQKVNSLYSPLLKEYRNINVAIKKHQNSNKNSKELYTDFKNNNNNYINEQANTKENNRLAKIPNKLLYNNYSNSKNKNEFYYKNRSSYFPNSKKYNNIHNRSELSKNKNYENVNVYNNHNYKKIYYGRQANKLSINLTIRYETTKFNIIVKENENNSMKIAEKINKCLNLCLNSSQLNDLAIEIANELNNIIKNVILKPTKLNYSSIIDINKIIGKKESKNNNYKIGVNLKYGNNCFNFIIGEDESEKEIELIIDNIVKIMNKNGKYEESILKREIINKINTKRNNSYKKS